MITIRSKIKSVIFEMSTSDNDLKLSLSGLRKMFDNERRRRHMPRDGEIVPNVAEMDAAELLITELEGI